MHPLTTRETLSVALKAYEHVRAPMAKHVLKASRENGVMYEFDSPELEDDYTRLSTAIEKQFEWIWSTHPEDEVNRAITYLASSSDGSSLER